MRLLLGLGMLMVMIGQGQGAPFEMKLHEHGRERQNTGTITLREPVTDRVLGVYEFVTGGLGRGSAPFGKYEIGAFRGLDDDPLHIGERFMVRHTALEDGEAWDEKIHSMRTDIELHMLHSGRVVATFGCFGVKGGPKVWAQFLAQIRYLKAWIGVVGFEMAPAIQPSDSAVTVAAEAH